MYLQRKIRTSVASSSSSSSSSSSLLLNCKETNNKNNNNNNNTFFKKKQTNNKTLTTSQQHHSQWNQCRGPIERASSNGRYRIHSQHPFTRAKILKSFVWLEKNCETEIQLRNHNSQVLQTAKAAEGGIAQRCDEVDAQISVHVLKKFFFISLIFSASKKEKLNNSQTVQSSEAT